MKERRRRRAGQRRGASHESRKPSACRNGKVQSKRRGSAHHRRDSLRSANTQGGDPIANLDLGRSIFFSNPGYTLGSQHKAVLTQAQLFGPAYPSDAKYVENVIWAQSQTLFVTINLPGGSNNDNDIWYGAPTMS